MSPAIPAGTRSVAFLGPSLPAATARALAPADCVLAPPVRFGDLYRLVGAGVRTVLIIDGVFHGDTPVWQREILAALDAGIRVVGAASMGALRALELAPHGMLGLGTVVAWYRDGLIEGDDEVALLHAVPELDYRAMSLPLVDVRFALGGAEGLPAGGVARLLGLLKQLGYADRTRSRILAEAAALGLDVAIVGAALAPNRPGLKAADAALALRALADPDQLAALAVVGTTPPRPRGPLPERAEAVLMRAGFAPDGRMLPLTEALQRAAGTTAAARRLREASRRWFLADWCRLTGRGPTPAERAAVAEAHLAAQAGVAGATPADWLRASAVAPGELADLLAGAAAEAWLLRHGAAQAGLPDPAAHPSPIPLALLDWASRMGVTPPPGDVDAQAAWLVQAGPAAFGIPDWNADVALLRAMQAEGAIAAMTLCPAADPPDAR